MLRFLSLPTLPTLRALRRLAPLALLLAMAAPAHASRAEFDDYDYHRDGGATMNVLDDPGNGGPAPSAVPLGSDATLAALALLGGVYGTRVLRRSPSRAKASA